MRVILSLFLVCFWGEITHAQQPVLRQGPAKKSSKNYSFPIFGDIYADTPLESTDLKGQVYYLVSGHGGPDPGAMAKTADGWLCEDEYAYDITLRLARKLLSQNAKVYIIVRDPNDGIRNAQYLEPDRDERVWGDRKIPLNQKERLKQRAEIINDLYSENQKKGYKIQRCIEIHVDSRYEGQKVDVFFYYKEGSKPGEELAKSMQRALKDKYDTFQKNRGYTGSVSARDLYMLRQTIPPMVYIEVGNIANIFDQRRLLIPNNRQALANWLALGIQMR